MTDPAATASSQFSTEQLEWSATQDLAQRAPHDEVVRKLIRNGMSAPDAMQLVTNLQSSQRAPVSPAFPPSSTMRPMTQAPLQQYGSADLASAGMRAMLIGLAICAVGAIVTIGSYASASTDPHGRAYLVCWGAIIFGGIRAVRGLMIWMQNR